MNALYAHTHPDFPHDPTRWQSLDEHLRNVAEKAEAFAAVFDSADWANTTGYLHDLGKARKSFQDYLRASNGLSDTNYDASDHTHSGAGAVWAAQVLVTGKIGRIFAYLVAGHHAGLPDWVGGVTPQGALGYRLEQEKAVVREPSVAAWIRKHQSIWLARQVRPPWRFEDADVSFWIRMLYSCQVDADFLDTEAFMESDKAVLRSRYPTLLELSTRYFSALDEKQRVAKMTPVNRIRAEIREACESAADAPRGLFSLTVPTGGGKTLSGTAFALRHGLKHGLKRIIYVIPYTSIIEQTADVLRSFLGPENVVEHHSNFDPDKETQQSRLATDNWDAPVVVTTNVQFFESLYACTSSRCRKLHNIADSVVILDEAQLLPPRLLLPCVEAMRQLVTHYGVSLVLSTATQPALPGLEPVCEIIPADMDLYGRLKRTEIEFPLDRTTRRTWRDVAGELEKQNQVLCVVNTRKDCRELHALMPEGTIHLSASMCGEHRSRVIAAIKAKLAANEVVRVVSTQLVEAGVDIDFPVVYRAFAGLASIAQAAGRCNREGLSAEPGRVVVFMPPQPAPIGELRKAEDTMLGMLTSETDATALESYTEFFRRFYAAQNDLGTAFAGWLAKDARDFQFQFREVAQAFQMIEDAASETVIVRYGENKALIRDLCAAGPKRNIMRRLQRFTVNVPRRMLATMRENGFVQEPHLGIYIQADLPSLYSEALGLKVSGDAPAPEDLVI